MMKFAVILGLAVFLLSTVNAGEVSEPSIKALKSAYNQAQNCMVDVEMECGNITLPFFPCKNTILQLIRASLKICVDFLAELISFGLNVSLSLFNAALNFLRTFFSGCQHSCAPCIAAVNNGKKIDEKFNGCQKKVDDALKGIDAKDRAENAKGKKA